jgi:hypothetical protein
MAMIDRELLARVAYAMEAAYKKEDRLGTAVHSVAEKFPELDTSTGILSAMWLAIDAFVDLNT